MKQFGVIEQVLPTKADKSELIDLQNQILDKLRDMIQQILQQFANKEDVMRRFSQLSKKIREILDLLNRGAGEFNEDGMFTKKHIGPMACASCEKGLTNLQAQQADYHVWKKLPFRDPAERIARYGPGFSKILSHMRPNDMLSGSPSNRRSLHHQTQSIDDTALYYNNGGNSAREELKTDALGSSTGNGFFPKSAKKNQNSEFGRNVRQGLGSSTNPGSSINDGGVIMGDTQDFAMQNYSITPAKERPMGIQQSADDILPALKVKSPHNMK